MTKEESLLAWPSSGDAPNFVTMLTCGHRGLLSNWTFPIIGERQLCEVCGRVRTIVGVTDL